MKITTVKNIYALLRAVKSDISDEYRAFEDDEKPGIQVTFATDGKGFTWQTGDNSFTGGCYTMPDWIGPFAVYRDTDCHKLAREIAGEINSYATGEKPHKEDSLMELTMQPLLKVGKGV